MESMQGLSARILEHGKSIVFLETPIPELKKDEVLIEMEFAGCCHTDLHVMKGDWQFKSKLPLTLGHEGVGRVVRIGENVKSLKIGDRVCSAWLHGSCGNCEHCWSAWETVCEKQENTGFSVDGSFTQYMVAQADFCGRVPDNLSSEQAVPISCAGVTTYKALKVCGVSAGQWVVFVGAAGGLGHVGVQYAKAMGMKVIGVDVGSEKLDFMKQIGCDEALDGSKVDVIQEVIRITGSGAHGSIILVPVQKCVDEAVKYLRRRGTVVLVALPPGNFSANTVEVVLKAITIKGSIVGNRLDLDEALRIASDGKVTCNVEVRNFRDVNVVLEELAAGKVAGRIVLDISKI